MKMKMEEVDASRANDGRENEDNEREDLSISTPTSIKINLHLPSRLPSALPKMVDKKSLLERSSKLSAF